MDLDPSRYSEADRREVNPPVPVDMASWSNAGTLDWWVKERLEWFGRYAMQTVVNGGSELLIFVPRVAFGHESWCCESHATWTG
jgi:hypothetical protein